ncbi:hypothetical protein ACOMHN_053854 [Nucella lapillus]
MDSESFKKHGAELLHYVTSYLDNIRARPVCPDVQPGFLRELVGDRAPDHPQSWEDVFQDIEKVIMPGVVHWQSPKFFGYWSVTPSYASMLGNLLENGLGCLGFSWDVSPMSVELEMAMMDWLARMLHLPSFFLFSNPGPGGGMLQGNASEATLTCLLAARTLTFRKCQRSQPGVTLGHVIDRLVAYCSDQAHSSVFRAGLVGAVRMRALETDDKGSLRGITLKAAILEDKAKGLIPFFLCATLGSTPTCGFDNMKELGPICEDHDVWMHVDAAYAGSAFICPEFRPLMEGMEFATSFNFNAHKWLRTTYECSPLWVKNTDYLQHNFEVESDQGPPQQAAGADVMPVFRHWQIAATSHPCRALKMWFVLRLYGLEGLQKIIRHDVQMAHEFEALVRTDDRFEIIADVIMGFVCFRLKGPNQLSEALLTRIRGDGHIYMGPAMVKGRYVLRLAICGSDTQSSDVSYAWDVIKKTADVILASADGHVE